MNRSKLFLTILLVAVITTFSHSPGQRNYYHKITDHISLPGPSKSPLGKKIAINVDGAYKAYEVSNGFISAAYVIKLVNENDNQKNLELAHSLVEKTFAAKPNLAEVDIAIYQAKGFKGFSGPLPLLTASIPRSRFLDFINNKKYDRIWFNPEENPSSPERKPISDRIPTNQMSLINHLSQVTQLKYGDPNKKMVALTFDDAPHPVFTPLLLDLLKRYKVQATFFCIGRNAVAFPYFVKDIDDAGFEVANHTYNHVRLPKLQTKEIESELIRANLVLESITKKKIKYFRPPGGELSPQVLEIASSLGLTTALWTDAPADFRRSIGEIAYILVSDLKPGGVVLLHDNVLATMAVLPTFIDFTKKQALELVSFGKLFS